MQDQELDFGGRMLHRSKRKRVVIVDDSRSIRRWLRGVFEEDPRLIVVGEASCALTARQVIRDTDPNVVTLDIDMPGMNGLEFLVKLMTLRPMPVVMISATTHQNSEATITALTAGAIDCIVKPTIVPGPKGRRDMCRRVFSAACSKVITPPGITGRLPASSLPIGGDHQMPLVLIGASTGGVNAIEHVLAGLDADGPPVVIVQHMPGAFLVSFSQLLNRNLAQNVGIARAGEVLHPGQVRLAPAQGRHTEILCKDRQWICRFSKQDDLSRHCPSVDVLFKSAAQYGRDIIAVILTGLGRDGAEGLLQLHAGGARTIGQDQQSCVIYGMPRAAFELGAVDLQLPPEKIGGAVNRAIAAHAEAQRIGERQE